MTQEEKAEQVIKNIYKYVYNKSTKSTQHAVIVLIRDIRLYLKINFNKDKKIVYRNNKIPTTTHNKS